MGGRFCGPFGRAFDARADGKVLGRRDFLRGIALTGVAATTGGLLAGCSSGSKQLEEHGQFRQTPAKPKRGGNLKVGLSGGSTSDTLDPHQGLTYLDTGRFEALYQPLVKLNKERQGRVRAGRVHHAEHSADAMDHQAPSGRHVPQREDPHGGRCGYTMNRIVSNSYSGTLFFGPVDIKGVKAVDKLTVTVPMKTPFGSFVDSWRAAGTTCTCAPASTGKPGRDRAVRLPELHAGAAQCLRPQQELLEDRPPLHRHSDHHRLQRQHRGAGRPDHPRHPGRGSARPAADGRAGQHLRGEGGRFAHRSIQAVHHARRPGAIQ